MDCLPKKGDHCRGVAIGGGSTVCTFCGGLNCSKSKGGALIRALASHQCGPGSNPGVDAICGLSLLLFFSFAPRGFSLGTPVSPLLKNQHFLIPNSTSTRNGKQRTTTRMCYL